MVDEFQKEHAFSDVEYARVLTKNGKLYSVKGTIGTVDIESFVPKEELEYAVVIHNHPAPKDEDFADAFSIADLRSSLKNKTSIEYLVTGEKKYSFKFTEYNINENEFYDLYETAKIRVFQKSLDGELNSEFLLQYEIMKELSLIDERIKFYEL